MIDRASTQRNLKEEITLTPTGFLFDHVTGLTYTVNSTGNLILRKLMEGGSVASAIQAVVEDFDVSESSARKDLEEFVEQARSFGVL